MEKMKKEEKRRMGRVKKCLAEGLALVLMLAIASMYGMVVKAAQSGDYVYEVNADGNSVTIWEYNGNGGDVVIPSEIDGKRVVGINKQAFLACSSLKSVEIPGSVTSIGEGAFLDCGNLTSIKVAEDNNTYDSRENCNAIVETKSNTLIRGCRNTIIPDSITNIGERAFSMCDFTSIEIPGSVTSIGKQAFFDCLELESAEISDGVVNIGEQAFSFCKSLKSVNIPESVTEIGTFAFSWCSSLESVELPGNVTEIGMGTFYFGGLKSVKIPDGVASIGGSAFQECPLRSIGIPESVTSIGESAFSGCGSIRSIEIPGSVTNIGESAFSGCSLTNIKVAEDNNTYDSRENCNAIVETKSNTLIKGCVNTIIPDSITNIGESAFSWCGFKSVEIPDSVTSIGRGAFANCYYLTDIKIPANVTSIEDHTFYSCISLENVQIPDGVNSIGNYAFYFESAHMGIKYSLTSIRIPSSVSNIGEFAIGFYAHHVSNGGVTSSEKEKIPGFVIYGDSGSIVEDYAKENGFAFNKESVSQAVVMLSQDYYIYDGGIKTPNVTVKLNGKTLMLNTDYTVSYNNNTNIGTATVTVIGIGSYAGMIKKNFTIMNRGNIAQAAITLSQNNYIYDGWAKTPTVTVRLDGKTLSVNTDYMVTYSNNVNAGIAKVIVTGIGNYTGNKSVDFTIVKAPEEMDSSIACKETVYKVTYGIKPFKINAISKSKLTFTSSDSKIAAVDQNDGTVTIKGTGVAVITVTSEKHYVEVTVKISPKKQSLKSAKTVKGRKLTVKWAKDKNATGYQVQISTGKKFKKIAKQKNLTKNYYTFTKLKTGKKYYVRARSYKKSGKEMLYGAWSRAKQSGTVKR